MVEKNNKRTMSRETGSSAYNVPADISLRSYLLSWYENDYCPRVSNTTKMIGFYTLESLILPAIENDVQLRYANSDYLDGVIKRASQKTKSAGEQSRTLLKSAFNDAIDKRLISRNPVSDTQAYPRVRTDIRLLNKEELKMMLEEASKSEWYPEILLGLFCGLRKGEILGLKYDDIDWDRRTVHICRQVTQNPIVHMEEGKVTYHVIEKLPKTENSDRILKLPYEVYDELRKRYDMYVSQDRFAEGYNDLGYVSCQKNGLSHSTSAMNMALKRICMNCGLTPISVHTLRHQYATILAESGVSLARISALLGHSSITVTYEYYIGVMDENERIIEYVNGQFRKGACDA